MNMENRELRNCRKIKLPFVLTNTIISIIMFLSSLLGVETWHVMQMQLLLNRC